jgi:MFS family permease
VTIGVTSSFAVAVVSLFIVAAAMGVMMPVRQAYLHQVTESEQRATVISFDAMVTSLGGVGGQAGLGALSSARSLSAGYVVGGVVSALSVPVLILMRKVAGPADQLGGTADPGTESTCPAGLPRVTGVQSVPVSTLTKT